MTLKNSDKSIGLQTDGRLENFVAIARKTTAMGSHPAAKELFKRPRSKGRNTRIAEFARIERGIEA